MNVSLGASIVALLLALLAGAGGRGDANVDAGRSNVTSCTCAHAAGVCTDVMRSLYGGGSAPSGPLGTVRALTIRQCHLQALRSSAFRHFSHLEQLDASFCLVRRIEPGSLASVGTTLQRLTLRGNLLSTLKADWFSRSRLAALRTLDLSANALDTVEDGALASLPALEELDLSRNRFTTVNGGWFGPAGSPTLLRMDLSANAIESLSDGALEGVPTLEALNLSLNALTAVDVGFFRGLTSLSHLDLSVNNISKLFEAFNRLSALEVLNLRDNSVVRLEVGTFRGLSALVSLDLSRNAITSMESGVFAGAASLEELDLSHNALERLDAGCLDGLAALLRLDLSANALTALSDGCFAPLTSLQRLNMSSNRLSSLPEPALALSSLAELDVSLNPDLRHLLLSGGRLRTVDAAGAGLMQLPAALTRSVRVLRLPGNAITTVRCGDADSYPLLAVLDLSANSLSELEEDALGRLELLVTLYLSKNALQAVPRSLPSSLRTLSLDNNPITEITPLDLQGLPRLKVLSMAQCRISAILDGAFSMVPALQELDLSGNPLVTPLPTITGPLGLTVLRLLNITMSLPQLYDGAPFPVAAPERLEVLELDGSPGLARRLLDDAATLAAFRQLRELGLSRAGLQQLPSDLPHFLPRLRKLRLHGNPWVCKTENVLWLARWLRQLYHDSNIEDIDKGRCAEPLALQGEELTALTEDKIARGLEATATTVSTTSSTVVTVTASTSAHFATSQSTITIPELLRTTDLLGGHPSATNSSTVVPDDVDAVNRYGAPTDSFRPSGSYYSVSTDSSSSSVSTGVSEEHLVTTQSNSPSAHSLTLGQDELQYTTQGNNLTSQGSNQMHSQTLYVEDELYQSSTTTDFPSLLGNTVTVSRNLSSAQSPQWQDGSISSTSAPFHGESNLSRNSDDRVILNITVLSSRDDSKKAIADSTTLKSVKAVSHVIRVIKLLDKNSTGNKRRVPGRTTKMSIPMMERARGDDGFQASLDNGISEDTSFSKIDNIAIYNYVTGKSDFDDSHDTDQAHNFVARKDMGSYITGISAIDTGTDVAKKLKDLKQQSIGADSQTKGKVLSSSTERTLLNGFNSFVRRTGARTKKQDDADHENETVYDAGDEKPLFTFLTSHIPLGQKVASETVEADERTVHRPHFPIYNVSAHSLSSHTTKRQDQKDKISKTVNDDVRQVIGQSEGFRQTTFDDQSTEPTMTSGEHPTLSSWITDDVEFTLGNGITDTTEQKIVGVASELSGTEENDKVKNTLQDETNQLQINLNHAIISQTFTHSVMTEGVIPNNFHTTPDQISSHTDLTDDILVDGTMTTMNSLPENTVGHKDENERVADSYTTLISSYSDKDVSQPHQENGADNEKKMLQPVKVKIKHTANRIKAGLNHSERNGVLRRSSPTDSTSTEHISRQKTIGAEIRNLNEEWNNSEGNGTISHTGDTNKSVVAGEMIEEVDIKPRTNEEELSMTKKAMLLKTSVRNQEGEKIMNGPRSEAMRQSAEDVLAVVVAGSPQEVLEDSQETQDESDREESWQENQQSDTEGSATVRRSHPGMFVLLAVGAVVAAALGAALPHLASRRGAVTGEGSGYQRHMDGIFSNPAEQVSSREVEESALTELW